MSVAEVAVGQESKFGTAPGKISYLRNVEAFDTPEPLTREEAKAKEDARYEAYARQREAKLSYEPVDAEKRKAANRAVRAVRAKLPNPEADAERVAKEEARMVLLAEMEAERQTRIATKAVETAPLTESDVRKIRLAGLDPNVRMAAAERAKEASEARYQAIVNARDARVQNLVGEAGFRPKMDPNEVRRMRMIPTDSDREKAARMAAIRRQASVEAVLELQDAKKAFLVAERKADEERQPDIRRTRQLKEDQMRKQQSAAFAVIVKDAKVARDKAQELAKVASMAEMKAYRSKKSGNAALTATAKSAREEASQAEKEALMSEAKLRNIRMNGSRSL